MDWIVGRRNYIQNPHRICWRCNKMTVVKIIELVGSSPKSWEDAAKNALADAARTVKNIKSMYVKRCNAKIEKNKIVEYRAVVKLAFIVEREK
jgi:dodecin